MRLLGKTLVALGVLLTPVTVALFAASIWTNGDIQAHLGWSGVLALVVAVLCAFAGGIVLDEAKSR